VLRRAKFSLRSIRFPTRHLLRTVHEKPSLPIASSKSAWLSSLLAGGLIGFVLVKFYLWKKPTLETTQLPGKTNVETTPFLYPSLLMGLDWRQQSATKLQAYMEENRPVVVSLTEGLAQAQKDGDRQREESCLQQLNALKLRIRDETLMIMFGTLEPPREAYVQEFGCARWTDPALAVVKSYSPLLELGAGHGQWQKALQARGADIMAFDTFEELPLPAFGVVGNVHKGGIEVLKNFPRRNLLLVYPPLGDMATTAAKSFQGEYLVYVGEGWGGANAEPQFFRLLETEWDVVQWMELDPYPQCFERLFVLKRKERKQAVAEKK